MTSAGDAAFREVNARRAEEVEAEASPEKMVADADARAHVAAATASASAASPESDVAAAEELGRCERVPNVEVI